MTGKKLGGAAFLPLKDEFFQLFVQRKKPFEYRPPRLWSLEKCRIGREIIISRGYGLSHRLRGRITSYRVMPRQSAPPAAQALYPNEERLAQIGIEVLGEWR